MLIRWYENFLRYEEEELPEKLEEKFLVKDEKGEYLNEGDYIQGFNNKKWATDKSKLYKTNKIKVTYPEIYRLIYGDTLEFNPETGCGWFWRVE